MCIVCDDYDIITLLWLSLYCYFVFHDYIYVYDEVYVWTLSLICCSTFKHQCYRCRCTSITYICTYECDECTYVHLEYIYVINLHSSSMYLDVLSMCIVLFYTVWCAAHICNCVCIDIVTYLCWCMHRRHDHTTYKCNVSLISNVCIYYDDTVCWWYWSGIACCYDIDDIDLTLMLMYNIWWNVKFIYILLSTYNDDMTTDKFVVVYVCMYVIIHVYVEICICKYIYVVSYLLTNQCVCLSTRGIITNVVLHSLCVHSLLDEYI